MAKVATRLLKIAKVAKKLPSNLWLRIGAVNRLKVPFLPLMLSTVTVCRDFFLFGAK